MRTFLKFLRPLVFLRRKAIYAGLLGGNRKWLAWGGLAWGLHWLGRLLGIGEPSPRYTRQLAPGERVVVVHEPVSPLAEKKALKKQRRAAKRAARS